jgi:glutathione S-transferase
MNDATFIEAQWRMAWWDYLVRRSWRRVIRRTNRLAKAAKRADTAVQRATRAINELSEVLAQLGPLEEQE